MPSKLPFSLPVYVGNEHQGIHTVFAADHAIVAECYHRGIAERLVTFFNGQATPPEALLPINPAYPSFKAMERDAHDACEYRRLRDWMEEHHPRTLADYDAGLAVSPLVTPNEEHSSDEARALRGQRILGE